MWSPIRDPAGYVPPLGIPGPRHVPTVPILSATEWDIRSCASLATDIARQQHSQSYLTRMLYFDEPVVMRCWMWCAQRWLVNTVNVICSTVNARHQTSWCSSLQRSMDAWDKASVCRQHQWDVTSMYINCLLLGVRLDSAVMSVLHHSYQITHNRVTPTTAATLTHHTPVSKVIHLLYLLALC